MVDGVTEKRDTSMMNEPGPDSLLHPIYGWHRFDRGFSWRKFGIVYGAPGNQPSLVPFFAVIFALLCSYSLFQATPPTLERDSLLVIVAGVGFWGLWVGIRRIVSLWQLREFLFPPPSVSVAQEEKHLSRGSPARIVDGLVAMERRVLATDRSTVPARVYTGGYRGPVLGEYIESTSTDTTVVVYHIGANLMLADRTDTSIEHLLAITELHELSHWALGKDNKTISTNHSEQWNRTLANEVSYVADVVPPLGTFQSEDN